MSNVKLDLDAIKARDAELARMVGKELSIPAEGEVELTDKQWWSLTSLTRTKLIALLQKMVEEEKEASKAEAQKYEDQYQEDVNRAAEQSKVIAMEKAAYARLNEYFAGKVLQNTFLVDSLANRELFHKTWKEHQHLKSLPPSPQLVDAVIALCKAELEWRATAAPTPAPAPVPEPVTLSDGSEQLSIDAIPDRKHTVVQLRDLDARRRALKAGEGTLAPLENGEPRLPLGTKLGPKHSIEQRRDLERRTARAWARQQGSVGGSFFSNDSQVR